VGRWLSALRSLEASALRRVWSMPAMQGALRNARGAPMPQAGQVYGSRDSVIDRVAVNGPHIWQI
jgi:hypothetical protein